MFIARDVESDIDGIEDKIRGMTQDGDRIVINVKRKAIPDAKDYEKPVINTKMLIHNTLITLGRLIPEARVSITYEPDTPLEDNVATFQNQEISDMYIPAVREEGDTNLVKSLRAKIASLERKVSRLEEYLKHISRKHEAVIRLGDKENLETSKILSLLSTELYLAKKKYNPSIASDYRKHCLEAGKVRALLISVFLGSSPSIDVSTAAFMMDDFLFRWKVNWRQLAGVRDSIEQ